MTLQDLILRVENKVRKYARLPYHEDVRLAEFSIPSAKAARLATSHDTAVARAFFGQRGRTVHKWLHYLDIYERHFSAYRGKPVRMLEIGVCKGGSLQMWRDYFGPDAVIFGIDLDPTCATRADPPNQVRIGSQADPEFLQTVVAEMGAPDIVLDDGSHKSKHQIASFETLFPLLREGGTYVVEDVHTSYWPGILAGGLRRKGTFIEFVKSLIDDQHAWYHGSTPTRHMRFIGGIHVYDSLVVIDKVAEKPKPGHIQIS